MNWYLLITSYVFLLFDFFKVIAVVNGAKIYGIIPTVWANSSFEVLVTTCKTVPAGNSFTTDFAKAAIIGENLGQSEHTDFISISYSSTDYVGHQFGVASKEIEDT